MCTLVKRKHNLSLEELPDKSKNALWTASFGFVKSSTSPPGGNQVDGSPPASSDTDQSSIDGAVSTDLFENLGQI